MTFKTLPHVPKFCKTIPYTVVFENFSEVSWEYLSLGLEKTFEASKGPDLHVRPQKDQTETRKALGHRSSGICHKYVSLQERTVLRTVATTLRSTSGQRRLESKGSPSTPTSTKERRKVFTREEPPRLLSTQFINNSKTL